MREAAEYQQKTIEFTKSIKTSLIDILGIALESSGLGPVVTSINGQSGDVVIEIPRTGNITFLQSTEPNESLLIEGDIWFHQGDE